MPHPPWHVSPKGFMILTPPTFRFNALCSGNNKVCYDCEGLDIQVSAKYGGKPQSTEVNTIGVPISRHPNTAHHPHAVEPKHSIPGYQTRNPVFSSLKSFRCCDLAPPELCRAKLSDNERRPHPTTTKLPSIEANSVGYPFARFGMLRDKSESRKGEFIISARRDGGSAETPPPNRDYLNPDTLSYS